MPVSSLVHRVTGSELSGLEVDQSRPSALIYRGVAFGFLFESVLALSGWISYGFCIRLLRPFLSLSGIISAAILHTRV